MLTLQTILYSAYFPYRKTHLFPQLQKLLKYLVLIDNSTQLFTVALLPT